MLLNVGPAHPAMHGTVRIVMELSGESIERCDVQVGYLHRGFEKMCERGTWTQVFPYVDRCNYVSPMLNNVGFALACEKLLGITVPERCQWYRMALGELARMSDHLTCDGAMAMELGAFTPFLWMIKGREMIWDLMEEETGARLTHSFGRVGGMANPPTDRFQGAGARRRKHILDDHRRGRAPVARQPHLPRPPRRRRRHAARRRDLARLDGAVPARRRRAVRRAQVASLHEVRRGRVRRARGAGRATASIASWCASRRSGRARSIIEQCLERMRRLGPRQRRRPARHPAAQGRRLHDDRRDHPALQDRDGGAQAPGRRGLLVHRGRQRRARLLSS